MSDLNKLHTINAFDFMPKDQMAQDILIKRAKLFAVQDENNSQQQSMLVDYIKFKLGSNEYYGIPYDKTKEVMNNFLLTYVPNLPSFIAGIINFRGVLITVIDLKNLFGIAHLRSLEKPQLIIVNKENMLVGMLVDTIIGNDVYDPSSLDKPMISQHIKQEFIVGIHQGTIAIINIETILSDAKLHLGDTPKIS